MDLPVAFDFGPDSAFLVGWFSKTVPESVGVLGILSHRQCCLFHFWEASLWNRFLMLALSSEADGFGRGQPAGK